MRYGNLVNSHTKAQTMVNIKRTILVQCIATADCLTACRTSISTVKCPYRNSKVQNRNSLENTSKCLQDLPISRIHSSLAIKDNFIPDITYNAGSEERKVPSTNFPWLYRFHQILDGAESFLITGIMVV